MREVFTGELRDRGDVAGVLDDEVVVAGLDMGHGKAAIEQSLYRGEDSALRLALLPSDRGLGANVFGDGHQGDFGEAGRSIGVGTVDMAADGAEGWRVLRSLPRDLLGAADECGRVQKYKRADAETHWCGYLP